MNGSDVDFPLRLGEPAEILRLAEQSVEKSKKKFGEPIVVQFLLEVRREKCYFPAYFDRKSSEVYKQK